MDRAKNYLLLILPVCIILFLCAFWPLFNTLWSSVYSEGHFSLNNFAILINDDYWWTSCFNTLKIAIPAVSIEIVIGLFIAVTIDSIKKGSSVLRSIVLVPWLIPTVVSAKMWAWMLHDIYGIFNEILLKLSIINEPIAWTATSGFTILSIILVDVWKTTPLVALLMLAGLQNISQDCIEAAKIDGAGRRKIFFYIILPLMKPTIIITAILRMIDSIRIFDLVYIIGNGGKETSTMSMYIRQQIIEYSNIGIGSAAASFLFILTVLVMLCGSIGKNKQTDK